MTYCVEKKTKQNNSHNILICISIEKYDTRSCNKLKNTTMCHNIDQNK